MPLAHRLQRRRFLISSAASGLACAIGCNPQQETAPPVVQRTDVPLRVLLCGGDAWAEAISTAWGGIAEQPLALEVIHRGDAASSSGPSGSHRADQDFGRRVVEKMMLSDVAIVPCGLLPILNAEASFAPLGESFMDDAGLSDDRILPVLRESTTRWAGNQVAVPLGSVQPALLIAGETAAGAIDVPKTWDEYVQVAGQLQAAAGGEGATAVVAEPLAGGAAAKLFLWRASDADPTLWLFNRETFEPVLSGEVYVQTLETMRACAKLYGPQRLTAGEVWNAVASGQLKMAIAWPGASGDPPRVDSLGDALVAPLPRDAGDEPEQLLAGSPATGVMADPDSPIGLLSSRCRQTAVAKRFLAWLCGGEGSEMVRDAAPGMTVLRTTGSSPQQASAGSSYDAYLNSRLSSLQLRPTLRLHRYDRYLAVLDQQVLACLDGTASPSEALAATSQAWRAITAEVGEKAQAQAWRRAQGLRN